MAIFTNRNELTNRLDGHILVSGSLNLYYKLEVLNETLGWLNNHRYVSYIFDCSKWGSTEVIHDDLKKTLGFPDYYGENLNALNDCLSDMDVPYDGGAVLVLLKFDIFYKIFGEEVQDFLDVLEIASRKFLLYGRRFITLIQSNDPNISLKPVGACAIVWNGKEWLNKNRGL